jgi:hypothetical protein
MFHLCLEISISSNSCNLFQFFIVQLLYIVKEKWGKPDRKPYTLPDGLRNPDRNLMPEISQDYAQKPQRNSTFMNSASVRILRNNEYENNLTAKYVLILLIPCCSILCSIFPRLYSTCSIWEILDSTSSSQPQENSRRKTQRMPLNPSVALF